MPFTTACPSCDARLQAPDAVRGKRVKCKKCGEAFVARAADEDEADDRPSRPAAKAATKPRSRPIEDGVDDGRPSRRPAKASRRDDGEDRPRRQLRDEEDGDEPRPRKKKGKKKKAGSPVLLVVLIVGAVVLIGGGIGAYFAFIKEDKPVDQPVAKGDSSQGLVGKGGLAPVADGPWVEHVDADGKYRIKFPRQPIAENRTLNEGGMQLTVKAMMAQTGQELFVSNAIPIPDPTADPEVVLNTAEAQATGQLPGGATLIDKKEVSHAGIKGREMTLRIEGGLNGVVRLFVTNGQIYTVAALGPGFQSGTPNVIKFFESLKFE